MNKIFNHLLNTHIFAMFPYLLNTVCYLDHNLYSLSFQLLALLPDPFLRAEAECDRALLSQLQTALGKIQGMEGQ